MGPFVGQGRHWLSTSATIGHKAARLRQASMARSDFKIANVFTFQHLNISTFEHFDIWKVEMLKKGPFVGQGWPWFSRSATIGNKAARLRQAFGSILAGAPSLASMARSDLTIANFLTFQHFNISFKRRDASTFQHFSILIFQHLVFRGRGIVAVVVIFSCWRFPPESRVGFLRWTPHIAS